MIRGEYYTRATQEHHPIDKGGVLHKSTILLIRGEYYTRDKGGVLHKSTILLIFYIILRGNRNYITQTKNSQSYFSDMLAIQLNTHCRLGHALVKRIWDTFG